MSGNKKQKNFLITGENSRSGVSAGKRCLGPKLLKAPGVKYLLSEVFSQDPLERYFSKQRHRGGSCENPTAQIVPYNASTLVQQRSIYTDLKGMNVDKENKDVQLAYQPLKKRPRKS